ncbi:MAG: hypothetical protein ACK4PR_04730 [Gammaproteobacteria bacterium]
MFNLFEKLEPIHFKKLLVISWMLWWVIAFLTDVFGGLKHIGLLNYGWAFDGNYPFLQQSLAMYHVPNWMCAFLFIGIILWSLLSAKMFIYACCSLNQPDNVWKRRASWAFIISLLFWFAFFLGDQITMKFDLEENHMVQAGMEFLSYLSLFLLPDVIAK